MTISFTGSQKGMTLKQKDAFVGVITEFSTRGAEYLVHGGCIGADELAHVIAMSQGYKIIVFPSDRPDKQAKLQGEFSRYPEAPPLLRNRQIVKCGQLLIACPRQRIEIIRSGTWQTVRLARKLGRQIILLEP